MHRSIGKTNKVIIYLLLLFILSTTNGKFLENQSSYLPRINKINIKGLSDIDNKKIFTEIKNLFTKNILFVDKKKIQKVISRYNIIDEYNIKKIYPSTINISIKPTKFIARLSINDQLVGANGKLIQDKKSSKILPYIFGEFDSQAFLNFKKNVIKSKFNFEKFKTLFFFPSNRWDILTNNDVLIKLPQDNSFETLTLADKILSSDDFKNINLIDLRMSNHLITR